MRVLVMSGDPKTAPNLATYMRRFVDASSMRFDSASTIAEAETMLRAELLKPGYHLLILDVRQLPTTEEPKITQLQQGISGDRLTVCIWTLPEQGKRLEALDNLLSAIIVSGAVAEFHKLVRAITLGHFSHHPA